MTNPPVANQSNRNHVSRTRERQRRLTELANAISASVSLSEILRMVRDAVVEAGGFDRAGVFLVVNGGFQGVWGTDAQGGLEDLSQTAFDNHPNAVSPLARVGRGEAPYCLTEDYTREYATAPDDAMHGIHAYAVIGMRVAEKVVGVLCVDNLLTDAPITEEDIETLLPFAGQAAVAIQNANLFAALRQANESLARSEKLRAVGELASGVAHNVNNALAAVLGYAEMIRDAEGVTAEIAHFARIIERAALDGADIVRRMQRFARSAGEPNDANFDLMTVCREAIDLARPAWRNQAHARGASIEIITSLLPGLPIYGDGGEIREVLLNLIRNAADAMPTGGALSVRCFAEDGKGVVTVGDTGVGMDETTQRRVFEPFFTTKSIGHGTGLGLSVAWGIVERMRGCIEVASAPGAGSVFTVRLPLAEPGQTPAPPAPQSALRPGTRLLLVEDEEIIAGGLARGLVARQCVVALAAGAREALDWLADNHAACDMIISDHGMVGMTGLELLATVQRQYPRLGRVLLSGWGRDLPGITDLSAAQQILAKPVRLDALVAALAQLQSANSALALP